MLSELEIEIGSDNNSQSNSDKNVVSLTLTTYIFKKKKSGLGHYRMCHYTIIRSADVLFIMWSCALEYSDIIHSQILDTLTIESSCLLIIVY